MDELFQLLNRKTGIPVDESRLIHAGKELRQKEGKRISDYPGIVHGSTMFMVMRLLGGQEKQPDEACQLTTEPDMITWDDDPNETRIKMPCGHAISPESLTTYCRSILDAGKFQFFCPYINKTSHERCNKEWDYIEVRRFAVLTIEEQNFFETKISDNYLHKAMGIQECPGCHSYCERANAKDKRVICKICTKNKGGCKLFEFCWSCLHEWKTSGIDKCGNEECGGEDPRIRILRDAPLKDVVGVQTPSCRACPQCGLLIEHTKACKHMVCKCGAQFCYICLKLKDATKGWQCGLFNAKCTVAPRQTVLSGL